MVATRANALGDYLRARREQLRPDDVGLVPGARRRVPGLRREEVATLAGISSAYYLRLEQGHDTHPSGQVVEALAQALRLDRKATEYLQQLASSTGSRPSVHRADSHATAAPTDRSDSLSGDGVQQILGCAGRQCVRPRLNAGSRTRPQPHVLGLPRPRRAGAVRQLGRADRYRGVRVSRSAQAIWTILGCVPCSTSSQPAVNAFVSYGRARTSATPQASSTRVTRRWVTFFSIGPGSASLTRAGSCC